MLFPIISLAGLFPQPGSAFWCFIEECWQWSFAIPSLSVFLAGRFAGEGHPLAMLWRIRARFDTRLRRTAQSPDSTVVRPGQPIKYVTGTGNSPPDFSPISHRYPLSTSSVVIS
jgi:hypothetical protein